MAHGQQAPGAGGVGLVGTALNASISRWRRRRREVPVPDLALVADRPAADGGASGGACGSVDPRIMAALLRLPARQRQSVAVSRGSLWTWCRPARSAPAASYPASDLRLTAWMRRAARHPRAASCCQPLRHLATACPEDLVGHEVFPVFRLNR